MVRESRLGTIKVLLVAVASENRVRQSNVEDHFAFLLSFSLGKKWDQFYVRGANKGVEMASWGAS